MAKILVLEDDYDLAVGWRKAMPQHDVVISLTSSEAIAHEENDDFDLYIVDLMIGGYDEPIRDTGQHFLIHLAKLYSADDIARRVIGASGFMAERDPNFIPMIYSSHGVFEVLKKPFDPSDLSAMVERMLGNLENLNEPPESGEAS